VLVGLRRRGKNWEKSGFLLVFLVSRNSSRMVLQNKYKARASKRYNASRGGISDTRGRGGGGRSRGSSRLQSNDDSQFPSLNTEEKGEGEDEDEDDEEGSSHSSGDDKVKEGGTKETSGNKYSRRKLESNAWRYQEEEIDPHEGEYRFKKRDDGRKQGLLLLTCYCLP
jgi:hypothetical protein